MSLGAPLPEHEADRQRALEGLRLFEGETHVAFERVARLAAGVFGAAFAFASLIDGDRQRCLAAHGHAPIESPRDASFAAHVVVSEQVLEVPDATQDARFAAHALVAGPPGVRYYAGVPLVLATGERVGALEVFDVTPRERMPATERATLQDLAAILVDALEQHAQQRKLAAADQEIERLVDFDPLTGALTRRGLTQRLEGGLSLARRLDRGLAVLVIDLAGAEPSNDQDGQRSGDDVLVAVAQRLLASVRDHDLVSRWGGDEFVVVLQGSDGVVVEDVAGRLAAAVDRPIRTVTGHTRLRASVGLARYPRDGEDALDLLRSADAAMYVAKRAGGGVVVPEASASSDEVA